MAVFLNVLLAGTIGLCTLADAFTAASLLREEKTGPLLSGLEARCKKMLQMQRAVNDDTKKLHDAVKATPDKKPTAAHQQQAVKLAESQKAILNEATSAIDLLRKEGVAVAFLEVFEMLRTDMKNVQGRLEKSDIGSATQTIQQDISDILTEMITALKKPRKTIPESPR